MSNEDHYEKQLQQAEEISAEQAIKYIAGINKLKALGVDVDQLQDFTVLNVAEGTDKEAVAAILLEMFHDVEGLTRDIVMTHLATPRSLPPPHKIKRLCMPHMRMYEGRIASGSPMVNKAECHGYLAIWRSIDQKDGVNLTPEEAREVRDAVDSGEFDDLLEGP